MYQLMLTTTLADNKAREETKAGRLQAAFYPVRGLEAVCAALGAALRPDDHLVSTYRNLGDAVAKGVSLRAIVKSGDPAPTGAAFSTIARPVMLSTKDVAFLGTTTGIFVDEGSGPVTIALHTRAQ